MPEGLAVVHIVWDGSPGGIQRLVGDLARVRARRQQPVGVALGRDEGPFADRLRAEGIRVHDLGLRSGYGLSTRQLRAAARILAGYDVVHLHGFNVPFALMAMASRRRVIFTEHGNFATGRALTVGDRGKRLVMRIFLRALRGRVAVISHFTATRMRELYGVDPTSLRIVPNGVDFERFSDRAQRREAPGTALRATFVGRLAGAKYVERLIEAVATLPPGTVDAQIVGSGPREPHLQALARRLGAEDRVEFRGFVADVPSALRETDVLVHPAVNEGFGLVIIEAAACGVLPLVFADGGGVIEVLPPDGVVVTDVAGCAAALRQLAGSPALAAPARAERARWVREAFPIERTAATYEQLYAEADG